MHKSSLDILSLYSEAFRDLVNAVNMQPGPAHSLHGLKDEDSWSVLCIAMDVMGDTCAALENFMRFDLDGPTRLNDPGERYLRLYGVLNATYLQQDAAMKVLALTQCEHLDKARERVNALAIRILRNKVGAHSVNYWGKPGEKTAAYAPVRIALSGFNCSITDLNGKWDEKHDLKAALDEHCAALADSLDQACEKVMPRLPTGPESRAAEFAERMDDIRFQRTGGIIVNGPGGKIRIGISGKV